MPKRPLISTTAIYLLMAVFLFVAESIIISMFYSYLARIGTWQISYHETAVPPVDGYYTTTSCMVDGLVVPCVLVSVQNRNPYPVDVYFVALASMSGSPVRIIRLLEETSVTWISRAYTARIGDYVTARIPPRSSAIFTAVVPGGLYPTEIQACTPSGCRRILELSQTLYVGEVIGGWNSNSTAYFAGSLMHQWIWRAETIGRAVLCCSNTTCITVARCCDICPPALSNVTLTNFTATCEHRYGELRLISHLLGYPRTVIVGYYSTDPSFVFIEPRRVVSNRTIYGFNSTNVSVYDPVVDVWRDYSSPACNAREVTIIGRVFVDPDRSKTLGSILVSLSGSTAQPRIYVSLRIGAENSTLCSAPRSDNATLEVYSVSRLGQRQLILQVSASSNSTYANTSSQIDLSSVVELTIIVRYRMNPENCGCSDSCPYYRRNVRLGFYVEIMP